MGADAMSGEVITSLAIQLPLVAAVIWVVMALLKDFRQANDQQQKELQGFIDQQNQRWQAAASQDRAMFAESLAAERERRREAMNQGLREVQLLAGSIDKLAAMVVTQSEAIVRHDAAAKERHDALLKVLAERQKSN